MMPDTSHLTAELAAVWEEMFNAVATILKSAELIDGLAVAAAEPAGQEISGLVGKIFEACAFQDISGQRIAKVAGELSRGFPYRPEPDLVFVDIPDDGLLNGPQLPGSRLDQDVVDRMLGFLPDDEPAEEDAVGDGTSADVTIDESKLLNGPQLPGRVLTQEMIDDLLGLLEEKA